MLGRGFLLHAGLLIPLLTVAPVSAERLAMITPTEEDILFGETAFRFAVAPGEPTIERVDVYVSGRLVGSAQSPDWSFSWHAPGNLKDPGILAVALSGGEVIEKLRLRPRTVTIQQDVSVRLVQLYPVVFDRRGRFVRGLGREAFEVLDQGKPIELKHFAETTTSSSVALAIDTSRSMDEVLVVVQDACASFVDKLGDRHALSVYSFDQAVSAHVEATRDSSRALGALRALRAGGGTALHDSLLDVLRRFDGVEGRRVVVLFSDGKDEQSVASRAAVVSAARRSGVVIYAIATVGGGGSRKDRDDIRELADGTGGEAYFVRSASELSGVFDRVARDIASQYILSYPVPPGPEGRRSVEVRVRDKGLRVRCRDEYFTADE